MPERGEALRRWLEARRPVWQSLAESLERQRDSRAEDPQAVADMVYAFRSLSRDLSLARRIDGGGRITRYLEALYLRAHEVINRPPRRFWRQLFDTLRDDVPQAAHALRHQLAAVTALFVGAGVVGWLLVTAYPDLAGLFASEEMIATVQSGELWTDGLLNIMPSSLLAVGIMTNNIVVALTAFMLGAFHGLGTIYIIGLNGLMLGGVFAFTRGYGLDGRLFEFVVAHGLVELSVICIAGAIGVRVGEALIRPGMRTRGDAFRAAVREASALLVLCVLFLIGAGVIEGFVSPDPTFGLPVRIAVGVAYWLLLYGVFTGRIWRDRAVAREGST